MNILKINGEEKRFEGDMPATLSQLLAKLNVDETTVVAEIDGTIIERGNFGKTPLVAGQKIELIRFVGGG